MSPFIGTAQAERLLDHLRPGLVVVDDAACAVATAAFAAGWQVALLKDDMTLDIIAKSRRADVTEYEENIALLLQTSGTTGEPKLVGLTRENLQASFDGVSDALTLSPEDRTLTLMPLTHIHGIVAVLGASLSVDAKVGIIPPRDPEAFWASIAKVQPTWLSMIPTLLQSILAKAPTERPAALAHLRFIRTSSSPLPASLRAKAEAYFGVPALEAYGMTEASHQIASARINATRPGAVGPASRNVDISLRHADGSRVASGDIDEVCVRGPNVIKEYIWPNDANAAAFHGDWFRTGDLGTLAEDGRIKLTGRIKEQINRGGATLSPIDIEDAILQHPDVAEAVVFPLPHDTLGEEVAALVVPVLGHDIAEAALQSQLSKALDFEHCPKFIFFTRVRTHNQNMTDAARAIAERKTLGQRS
ncbi:MAG: AMP-binding protein [Tateyamaria sp.]|uniref:AMP-binding protein n=1 Tax=Tateyamaria sp. TaxID=1929288 RepID=UPI00329CE393